MNRILGGINISNSEFICFLTTAGIYETFNPAAADQENLVEEFEKLFKYHVDHTSFPFNLYCPYCDNDSIFYFKSCFIQKLIDNPFQSMDNETSSNVKFNIFNGIELGTDGNYQLMEITYKKEVGESKVFSVMAHCAHDVNHHVIYFITISDKGITKVGQSPDVRLFQNAKELKKYKKMLNEYAIELSTALRLHSVNVGVGSYIYLRRILEKIMLDIFQKNEGNIQVTREEFINPRYGFENRIDILKNYLPEFMVKNKNLYSILSKGVHELDEKECTKHFDLLYESIKMILDDLIEANEKEAKRNNLTRMVGNLISSLRKDDTTSQNPRKSN